MRREQLPVEEIQRRLDALPDREAHNHFPAAMLKREIREAAVLILLRPIADDWHVQYIRRTEIEGDMHSGQVAFPGGRRDDGDVSVIATALRETEEELGIPRSAIDVLGTLRPFVTISSYRVTPVVGVYRGDIEVQPFVLQTAEVARAFTIPLDWLATHNHREHRQREVPGGDALEVIYFNEYDGELLWGATARFTVELLEALGLN